MFYLSNCIEKFYLTLIFLTSRAYSIKFKLNQISDICWYILYYNVHIHIMAYVRKSFETKPNHILIDEDSYQKIESNKYSMPPKPDYIRGRHASNEKKYNYQNDINESRQMRPRTPSASEYNKYKYDSTMLSGPQSEFLNSVSQGKLKRQAKNYAACIVGNNYPDLNVSESQTYKNGRVKYSSLREEPPVLMESQFKENRLNARNIEPKKSTYQYKERNYSKKNNEDDDIIKGSFERVNEEKILQKITRINKLNTEINSRLQRILAQVTSYE